MRKNRGPHEQEIRSYVLNQIGVQLGPALIGFGSAWNLDRSALGLVADEIRARIKLVWSFT
jgi:hypothetical protein